MKTKRLNITEEEKNLLLRYLTMASTYDLTVMVGCGTTAKVTRFFINGEWGSGRANSFSFGFCHQVGFEHIRPFLRPMSSMSLAERREFEALGWRIDVLEDSEPWDAIGDISHIMGGLDWLLRKHFDFMRLIDKGLAISTESNVTKTLSKLGK